MFGDDNLTWIAKTLIFLFKLIVPIILFVLGSADFIKAIFAQDESGIKKAQATFIKRLIVAAIIFLIPNVLQLLLTVASAIWPSIDSSFCGLL